MSRGQTLRALVNERLAAAAEDIFVLFERTIAEYEEVLCRSKEENQRKQQLLDNVLSPRPELVTGKFQIPWTSPGTDLNLEITETPRIKEEPKEQRVKQEEEHLPMPVPQSRAVCVKTEEASLLQQKQTVHREETQGEDISLDFLSQTEGHTKHSSDTDNDDDWESFGCTAAQIETKSDGQNYNQVQSKDRSTELTPQNMTGPETTVPSEPMSGAHGGGAERKKHQCPFCNKGFTSIGNLENHIRVHTGEKPYSCSICEKTFTQKCNLNKHKRTHTGHRPYSCLICEKTFTQKCNLDQHKRTHTGEKPYSCSLCNKTFSLKCNLDQHKRTHTEERPYICSIREQTFSKEFRPNEHQ